jgi:hypothetical protein
MDRWLRRVTTLGLARGLRGSRGWLIAGMAAIGLRALRRLANPGPDVLYRTQLRGGDMFEIVARAPANGRRGRRRRRTAE